MKPPAGETVSGFTAESSNGISEAEDKVQVVEEWVISTGEDALSGSSPDGKESSGKSIRLPGKLKGLEGADPREPMSSEVGEYSGVKYGRSQVVKGLLWEPGPRKFVARSEEGEGLERLPGSAPAVQFTLRCPVTGGQQPSVKGSLSESSDSESTFPVAS